MPKSIFDLSWNEVDFFEKLHVVIKSEKESNTIWLQEFRREWNGSLEDDKDQIDKKINSLSALSSTYYTVTGTAGRQIKRILWDQFGTIQGAFMFIFNIWQVPFWLLLGGYCFLRELPTSNKMLKIAGGYENLTADQCDVRQSILRRHRKWKEALVCIKFGLSKKLIGHTRAFLLIGRVYTHLGLKCFFEKGEKTDLDEAISIANAICVTNPNQAIRIFRHCGHLYNKTYCGDGKSFLKKAELLAKSIGAKDQLLKM